MRTLILPFALLLAASAPMAAQTARMFKVDIVSKSGLARHATQKAGVTKVEKDPSDPTEVHIRMPLSLVKAFLQSAGHSEIKINGKDKKGMQTDELLKLLETSKSGDMLFELTTDKGDVVKITLE
jgi:hypothetical protein